MAGYVYNNRLTNRRERVLFVCVGVYGILRGQQKADTVVCLCIKFSKHFQNSNKDRAYGFYFPGDDSVADNKGKRPFKLCYKMGYTIEGQVSEGIGLIRRQFAK